MNDLFLFMWINNLISKRNAQLYRHILHRGIEWIGLKIVFVPLRMHIDISLDTIAIIPRQHSIKRKEHNNNCHIEHKPRELYRADRV